MTMFKKISFTIALQFTGFVFLLCAVNVSVFLLADYGNAHRMSQGRLERDSMPIMEQAVSFITHGEQLRLPPPIRDRVRILDAKGNVLLSSGIFGGAPVSLREGFSTITVQEEPYSVLTVPLMNGGKKIGFAQIAGFERFRMGDLPLRWSLSLLVSLLISGLTFFVGLFFARRSLKPAEEMVQRLEQFTQDASHELRTPLAALSSSLDLALKTEKYREGVLSAKEDLKQVATLVERLLELARLDKIVIEMAPVDLSALLQESVERYRPLAAEKNITIEGVIEPKVIVQGEAALLRQVVGNLLSNAIKFNKPKNGKISLRLTHGAFSVEDTGIGIAKAMLPHIFDRFYQVEPSRSLEGFGLGLALVKRIVELHGWTVDVKSAEGKGTTFTIHLKQQD